MGRERLELQFVRVAKGRFHERVDKHSVKRNRAAEDGALIMSYARYHNLLDFSDGFCVWLRESGIRCRFVVDITAGDWNQFIEKKANTVSYQTLSTYQSNIRTWERLVRAFFKREVAWSGLLIKPYKLRDEHKAILRIQQMNRDDYAMVMEYANRPESKSSAPIALELSVRLGLRVEGTEKIRTRNIHLDGGGRWGYGTVDITEKGGRNRIIDIQSQEDRDYLASLVHGKDYEQPLVGISKDSINKYLNRVMDYLGIKEKYPETSMHSIRKMYAQETWDHCRNHGFTYDEALRYLNAQLGHGEERNKILLGVYKRNY